MKYFLFIIAALFSVQANASLSGFSPVGMTAVEANACYAGPASGDPAFATFRQLVTADIPGTDVATASTVMKRDSGGSVSAKTIHATSLDISPAHFQVSGSTVAASDTIAVSSSAGVAIGQWVADSGGAFTHSNQDPIAVESWYQVINIPDSQHVQLSLAARTTVASDVFTFIAKNWMKADSSVPYRFFKIGEPDAFSRPDMVWSAPNGIFHLGGAIADGSPDNIPSQGMVTYFTDLSGDPMTQANWGLGYFFAQQILLLESGASGAWFNVDPTSIYYANSTGNAFSVERATGNTMVGGSLQVKGLTVPGCVTTDASGNISSAACGGGSSGIEIPKGALTGSDVGKFACFGKNTNALKVCEDYPSTPGVANQWSFQFTGIPTPSVSTITFVANDPSGSTGTVTYGVGCWSTGLDVNTVANNFANCLTQMHQGIGDFDQPYVFADTQQQGFYLGVGPGPSGDTATAFSTIDWLTPYGFDNTQVLMPSVNNSYTTNDPTNITITQTVTGTYQIQGGAMDSFIGTVAAVGNTNATISSPAVFQAVSSGSISVGASLAVFSATQVRAYVYPDLLHCKALNAASDQGTVYCLMAKP